MIMKQQIPFTHLIYLRSSIRRLFVIGLVFLSTLITFPGNTFAASSPKPLFRSDSAKKDLVDLVSFDASFTKNKILLHWITATEKSTSHYVIQRSTDGHSFEDAGILFTEGDGNSSKEKDYKFPDMLQGVSATAIYYRLKVVNLAGQISFSKVILIKK
jgi:hypothetical protein